MQELKGKHLRGLAFVIRSERLSVADIRKQFLQFPYILMIPDNGVLLELLLLLDLFLVVVAVPEVIIAPDVREDSLHDGCEGALVLVVNGKLHEVVLKMVILKSDEFEGRELLFDVLQQIGDEVDVEGGLRAEAGLAGREET